MKAQCEAMPQTSHYGTPLGKEPVEVQLKLVDNAHYPIAVMARNTV